MKSRYVYCFFLFACLIVSNFVHARFDQAAFDKAAALYGNKTANLMELQKITEELNKTTPGRYAVPAFLGISHPETRAHLKTAKYSEEQTVADFIDAQWQDFKKTQPHTSTTLATDAQPILKTIRETTIAAFDPEKNPFIMQDATRFEQFINVVMKENKLLMVRSTGREDSKKLANAGGNESVSSVPPKIQAITAAIGVVVESYYSEKSLGQRLLAKDKTIFDKEPFLPVLQQIMIGEQIGGAPTVSGIPVSGVMFSQEAEGRTPGVTHIQATWGHNEGVVNGLVPVDSFYVSSVGTTDFIHPIVRIKQNRLVTMRKNGKNVLERKANPRAAQRVQCLTPQDVIDLKNGADAIVAHYNQGPYDIEFVILNGVIYWVQARPITHKAISPSYLKDEFIQKLDDKNKQTIYAIGAGGGKTHIIDSESAIIITDNIRNALSTFLKREDKDQVKAIIVGEMAPATSHEATTFRAEGMPVLYSAEVSTVQGWLKQVVTQNLLIDPQRELVALFSPSEQLKTPRDAIKDGWFAHPISKKVSVLAKFYQGKPKLETFEENNPKEGTSQLINRIKNSTDKTEVTHALESVLFRVTLAIKKQKDEKTINPQLIPRAIEVFKYLAHSAYEVQQAFDTWSASTTKTEQDRLKRLYPIVFFEALIKQIPASQEFVNDYSLSSLLKIELIEKRIVKKLELTETKWKEYLVQYAKAADVALTDGMKKGWNSFVKKLQTIPDEQQVPFVGVMFTIATLELMPLFINLTFAQTYQKQAGNTQKIVQALLDEFQSSQTFLKKLQEKAQQLNEINMANWGEPDKFPKQWEQFKTDILNYFMSDEFIQDFQKASTLGKNGAATVMLKLVDTFDRSIKALQASKQKYSNIGTLIERFKSMLGLYFTVLEKWVKMPSIINDLKELLEQKTFGTVDSYIQKIKTLIDKAPTDAATLEPSRSFNVAGAALGSKADWDISIGSKSTLEDVFTLIHQNLLVLLGQLIKKQGADKIDMPPLFKALKGKIEKLTSLGNPASLIGISINTKKLVFFYNQPLRVHSATFQIVYEIENKTSFAVQLIGVALGERWDAIAILCSLLSKTKNLSFLKEPAFDNVKGIVEFTWKIMNESQAAAAKELVIKLIGFTFASQNYIEHISFSEPSLWEPVSKVLENELKKPDFALKMLTNKILRDIVIHVINYLVKYKTGEKSFEAAIMKAVKQGIDHSDYNIKKGALILLNEFVVKLEKALPEAEAAAKKVVVLDDNNIKKTALDLFRELVQRGQAFSEAEAAAKKAVGLEDNDVKIAALDLFRELVQRGQAFSEAEEAAKKAVGLEDNDVKIATLDLFRELVQRGKAFPEAEEAAKKAVGLEDNDVKIAALDLFIKLVEKDQAIQKAQNAFEQLKNDKGREVRKKAFALGKELKQKAQN